MFVSLNKDFEDFVGEFMISEVEIVFVGDWSLFILEVFNIVGFNARFLTTIATMLEFFPTVNELIYQTYVLMMIKLEMELYSHTLFPY